MVPYQPTDPDQSCSAVALQAHADMIRIHENVQACKW